MTNIDDFLKEDRVDVDSKDFALESTPPVYTEDLPDVVAKSILGDVYDPNCIYKLITQEESTVVATFTKTGVLVDELTLETSKDVVSLGELCKERALRSDMQKESLKHYDLYEFKDNKKGYWWPIIVLLVLCILGVTLLLYTSRYLV